MAKKYCPLMSGRCLAPVAPTLAAGPESMQLAPVMIECHPELCAFGAFARCCMESACLDLSRKIGDGQ